jgi:hypothetical protein
VVIWNRIIPGSTLTVSYLHYHIQSQAAGVGGMAIYGNSGIDQPVNVLARTNMTAVVNGWNNIPIYADGADNPISSIQLNSGTTYWLAFQTSGAGYETSDSSSSDNCYALDMYSNSLSAGTWPGNPASTTYYGFGINSLLMDMFASDCQN